MSSDELKSEEREVLLSIYDGDENFKQVSDDVYQYKVQSSSNKQLLLEIRWSKNYPSCIPDINLDAFYNKKMSKDVKNSIINKVAQEAEQYLDMSMTYSLFEWVKENAEDLMQHFAEENSATVNEISASLETTALEENNSEIQKKPKEKKEQLTKAQKRKIINRCDQTGQLPRGWNWVDVIKHLSQVGSKNQCSEPPTS